MNRIKKTRYWVVVNKWGVPQIDTLHYLRKNTIESIKLGGRPWTYFLGRGYRVARVILQEVSK